MKLFEKYLSISALVLLGFTIVCPSESLAQGVYTSGYECMPKNIGGDDTRRYFRQQDGAAINISPNATFPIVCPVIIAFGDPFYNVVMRFGNYGDATQNFACALEEYNRDFRLVRSRGRSINIPPATSNSLSWDNVVLSTPSSYLTVRCILPPRAAVGLVFWQ